jgi:O-antigen ligase
MNRIAFVALWVLVFSLAWEEMVEVAGVGRISRLIGVVAFGVGILSVLASSQVRSLTRFHGAVALFICWSAASIYWSVDPETTYQSTLTFLQLALLLWLIWELAPTVAQQHALLQAYVLGAYLSAGYTIFLYLTSATALRRYAAIGYNANDLGFTLALALPMAWHLALVGRRSLLIWVNRLYLPIGLGAIILTASRGAAIPAAVALLLIPWTLNNRTLHTKIALGLLLAGSVYFLSIFVPQVAVDRLATIPEEVRGGSFSARGQIWQAGWEVARQHPIVGVGAGVFAEAVEPILGEARSPHQSFLVVLVGQGLIGLALFLAIFAVAAIPIQRMPPPQRKFWAVLILTLLIGMLPRTWDRRKPTWLVLGVLVVQTAALSQSRARGRQGRSGWEDLRLRGRRVELATVAGAASATEE